MKYQDKYICCLTFTRSCLMRPTLNSWSSSAPPRPRPSPRAPALALSTLASRWFCNHTMDLEEPNAVHWKYSNRVSKGNSMGQEKVSSWHQSGIAFAERMRGSCICCTNLFVIFFDW